MTEPDRAQVGDKVIVRDATGADHQGVIHTYSDGGWLVLKNGSVFLDWVRRKFIVSWRRI